MPTKQTRKHHPLTTQLKEARRFGFHNGGLAGLWISKANLKRGWATLLP